MTTASCLDTAVPATARQAPDHHPSEELLLDYAAGASAASEAALLAAHLTYCIQCRAAARSYAAIGGVLIDTIEPAFLAPNALNRALAAIDAAKVKREAAQFPHPDALLESLGNKGWRRLPGGYGMKRLRSREDKSGRVWLLKAPAGKGLLRHRHVGDEWTVVLQGAFHDETGRYGVGDFVRLHDGYEHQPMADLGEDCVCLIMVRDTPLYTGFAGRLAAPFVRL